MTGGFDLAPLVAWPAIAVIAAAAAVLLIVGAARGARGIGFRALALTVLVVALLNPLVVEENREPRPDVAVIVVDDSRSQAVGERAAQASAALAALRADLSRYDDLEVRIVRAPEPGGERGGEDTRLVTALSQAVADVPRRHFAGAILITDGQVHDVPAADDADIPPGPVHVLLTGSRGEKDRRLVVDKAPGYGLVGKSVTITYRVEDSPTGVPGRGLRDKARVSVSKGKDDVETALVPLGRTQTYTFTLEHAGPTVVELAVDETEGELSSLNNRAAVSINGVRDRLRVLLVSGQPHSGERTWRNLLKSDPAVDLVHFTILRPPEKDDFTPLRELALIVFPVRELFEIKLHEFDLIVFDRYMVRDVLPPSYLRNIESYVRQGGALLMAVGPEFSGLHSLFHTPLGGVMPAEPTGRVFEGGFRPGLTDTGRRHPVTATLTGGETPPRWGRWFRHIEAVPRRGVVLMGGEGGTPLLVLDRVEKGRVAQMLSDHIWLWARGFEGGGPQGELLRRLAHWLMKEPDLEEESLRARVAGGRLTIERQSLVAGDAEVTVTDPSGATRKVKLDSADGGRSRANIAAGERPGSTGWPITSARR